jgi:8-oxo-dGTP pyrophosphatase MutT (NUDIX family)
MTEIILHTEHNVRFLPQANKIEYVLTMVEAPLELTASAFVIPVFEDGTFLLAHNMRRGAEISGGHVESGETLRMAAQRECLEETGAHIIELKGLGFQRMIVDKSVPKPYGYKYPFPLSFQQFYAAKVETRDQYIPNDECDFPMRVSLDSIPERISTGNRLFIKEAIRLFAQSEKLLD